MARRTKALRKKLERAQKRRDGIRIVRSIRKADRLDAHVVGIGRRWVMLAMARDGSPDGYVVVRLKDIKHIYWDPTERFIRRSLKVQHAWPPASPSHRVDLDHGVKRLMQSVVAGSALVTIHPELDRTDVCYIGRPTRWGKRTLRLQEVDPQGRWEDEVEKHRIDTITRVDFDRTYENNLAAVAGKRPGVTSD